MPPQSLKTKVAKGAVWTLMEKLSTQVVGFIVGMVLARLLTPNDYGTVALTAIFFAVAGVLVDGGFSNALIQKKDADDLDFNSVFYMNLGLSVLVYVMLFFSSPLIAQFYKEPELIGIIRVSALCLVFNAVNAIQNAELVKKMLFHLSFRISLITCVCSAFCGISLALCGFGVWALVISTIFAGIVGVVARWFVVAWRPKLVFSWSRLKPLFSFGWKMALSGLLDTFFTHISGLLIGKYYSKEDLAFVNKGNSLPQLIMNQIDETLGRVSFPALVVIQDDRDRLREAMRRMIQCSTFLVFPLMVGVALCSNSLLRLFYGAQWTPAGPYMMLACFSFALWPFHTVNLRGIVAVGRSDIFLKLEIVKKILKLVVMLSALRYGVFAFVAASAFALGPMGVIINAWPNKRLLGYTIGMQLKDVFPTALICIVEAVVVCGVGLLSDLCAARLFVSDSGMIYMLFLAGTLFFQFVLGLVTFIMLAYAFKLKPMGEYAYVVARVLGARFPRFGWDIENRFSDNS